MGMQVDISAPEAHIMSKDQQNKFLKGNFTSKSNKTLVKSTIMQLDDKFD